MKMRKPAGRVRGQAGMVGNRAHSKPVFSSKINRFVVSKSLGRFIDEQIVLDTPEASLLVDCATVILDEVRRHD